MADPLVTKAQLEARLGAKQFERIFDDNNDGVSDKLSETQLREDASSKVRGGLPGYNPDDMTPANALISGELRRIALDACVAMCAQRRPTVLKMDWKELMDSVNSDLERIRKGQATLGANTNPGPADQSVAVASGDAGQSQYWP